MRAFIFDTETSGLVDNRSLALDKQPEIIEFYGAVVDIEDGERLVEIDSLCRPSLPVPWDSKMVGKRKEKGITEITGMTWDTVKNAPAFSSLMDMIDDALSICTGVVAHNLSFDMDMVELEYQRSSRTIRWPACRLCTVEQTVHLVGHRLTLTKLHELLFDESFKDAHRAGVDTQALIRCTLELRKRGLI